MVRPWACVRRLMPGQISIQGFASDVVIFLVTSHALEQLWRPESDPAPWIPLSDSDARTRWRRSSGNDILSRRAPPPRSTSLFIFANICMLGRFLHDLKKLIYVDRL